MATTKEIQDFRERTVIGFSEDIEILGEVEKKVHARIDSGATLCSMDSALAKELGLGPIVRKKLVKSAQGNVMKPVIKCSIRIGGRRIKASFTLADRKHLRFPVLIGQNVIRMNFLIDPKKVKR